MRIADAANRQVTEDATLRQQVVGGLGCRRRRAPTDDGRGMMTSGRERTSESGRPSLTLN
jgi:hypothetical protein